VPYPIRVLLVLTLVSIPALAQATKPSKPKPLPRHQLTDNGPFVTATIPTQWPEGGIVNKAIAIKFPGGDPKKPNDGAGGILFDTDTLRYAAGWTGGFVEFTKDFTSIRDPRTIKIIGTQLAGTKPGPGWANPQTGDWKDPRPNAYGPLPRPWAKYRGLYLHGEQVILSYTVGDCGVLDSPGYEEIDGVKLVTRTLALEKSQNALRLLACEWRDGTQKPAAIEISGMNPGTSTTESDGRYILDILPQATPCRLKILIGTDLAAAVIAAAHKSPAPADLAALTHGGPPRWNQTIETAGVLNTSGTKSDAYVVDTLTLPEDNPWKSWIRPGGFDFFTSDPTKAAMCVWGGDVWVVSGIDAELKHLKWRRIATGLYQPLGLKIVDDAIYVVGRDQITILRDLNGDGETDFYECFNNDVQVTPSFHEFAFDLWTDPAGYFYTAKAGPVKNGGHGFDEVAEHHGSVLRISPDGRTLERYATGFRAPNGICVGPDGQVTTGDNEGSYVPMCRINWLKPGGFYGVVDTAHRAEKPKTYDGPLCWMPKDVDNSSGCQVWVTSNKWGPLAGRLLHLSYGQSSLFLVLKEEIDGEVQGGVVKFPLKFDSGIMRARFNSGDGQLYVAGLKGWQTNAARDGCLQRVRYTGKPIHMPVDLHVSQKGVQIRFLEPLDRQDAADPANYAVERWNYLWSSAYGSSHYSVKDPQRTGHDPVDVKSARLSADGKTLELDLEDVGPVMQQRIDLSTAAADGAPVKWQIHHTIHRVGE
jgi:hypothetical protein